MRLPVKSQTSKGALQGGWGVGRTYKADRFEGLDTMSGICMEALLTPKVVTFSMPLLENTFGNITDFAL